MSCEVLNLFIPFVSDGDRRCVVIRLYNPAAVTLLSHPRYPLSPSPHPRNFITSHLNCSIKTKFRTR